MKIVPPCAVFQEDSSSQEKETKGTVCLLEEVLIVVCCEVMCGVWQWASPHVSEVCTRCSRVREESVCLGSEEKLMVATWVEWGLARCHLVT